MTDAEIVDRVRGGDVHAYGALVDRYEHAVFAAALVLIGDRHAAEDVTQEVFVRGYLKLGTLRDGSRVGPWLMKMARREARQVGRQRQRARGLVVPAAADATGAGRDGRLLDEDKEHLLRHVHGLPEHERITVALRYFDGHSVQQIADMTGRPVGTVTKRLSRAIERLRRSIGSEER